MSDILELEKLVERLEGLTGPDQATDCDIFRAIGAPLPQEFLGRAIKLEFNEAEHCFVMPIGDQRIRYTPPCYTASIDSALTLVPEGWWVVRLGELRTEIWKRNDRHEPTGGWLAVLQHVNGGRLIESAANGLTIALCIAALRARITHKDTNK